MSEDDKKDEYYKLWYNTTLNDSLEFGKLGSKRSYLMWVGYFTIFVTFITININGPSINRNILAFIILFIIGYMGFITLTTTGFFHAQLRCELEGYMIEKELTLGKEFRFHKNFIPLNKKEKLSFIRKISKIFYRTRLFSVTQVFGPLVSLYTSAIIGVMIGGWLFLLFNNYFVSFLGFFGGALLYILIIRTILLQNFHILYIRFKDIILDILKEGGWENDCYFKKK